MRVTVRGRRLTYTVLASGMRFSDRRLGVAYNMLAVMGKLERLCFVKFLWAVSAFLLVRLSGCF